MFFSSLLQTRVRIDFLMNLGNSDGQLPCFQSENPTDIYLGLRLKTDRTFTFVLRVKNDRTFT